MFIPDGAGVNPIEAARQQDEQAQQPSGVFTESVAEQQTEQVASQSTVAEEIPQPEQQQMRYSDRDVNIRVMRERAEAAERRAAEYERAMWQQQQPKTSQQPEYEDETLIEGKHLKKYDKKVEEVQAELEATKKQLAEFSATATEQFLRAKYTDLDAIVNDDNLERLSREKPGLYRSLIANPNLKDKVEGFYDTIKTFLVPQSPQNYAQTDKRIADNKAKPKASPSVAPQASDSPLSRAGDYDRRSLSDARKNELYEEMRRYRQ
jgi:hypothetical protein